jgi:putative flippase GtrA
VKKKIKYILNEYSILRWALVGSITLIIDYLIFISLYSIINSVLLSNFCAGLTSITFNYLSHYSWTFKIDTEHFKSSTKYLVNLFIFWSLGTILLSNLIASGIDPKLAKLLPIPVTAPLSFLSLKIFVFSKH